MDPRYVCPHCKKNTTISEISLAWVEYEGKFDNECGHINMFKGVQPNITDNPDDPHTYYKCNSCFKEFFDPLDLLEDEGCQFDGGDEKD